VKFLLRDRDTKFTAAWERCSPASGSRSCIVPSEIVQSEPHHLLQVLREYQTHHNEHRPHRSLQQAAPRKQLPAPAGDLDALRVPRHDRIGGAIHEQTLAA
jgi:hypothetical protein